MHHLGYASLDCPKSETTPVRDCDAYLLRGVDRRTTSFLKTEPFSAVSCSFLMVKGKMLMSFLACLCSMNLNDWFEHS